MKDLLRSLPVLTASPPPFDLAALPDDPAELFAAWLYRAIEAGVPEPHAMTVSTRAADGRPDARVLILKDLADGAWWFAGGADSVKGKQILAHPVAALTFYWPVLGRQVRIRGSVQRASARRSAEDFGERSLGSRASAMTGRQSTPLDDPADVAAATTTLRRQLDSGELSGLESWTLWGMVAERVEFWQSSAERDHTRVEYLRDGDVWRHGLLWP